MRWHQCFLKTFRAFSYVVKEMLTTSKACKKPTINSKRLETDFTKVDLGRKCSIFVVSENWGGGRESVMKNT